MDSGPLQVRLRINAASHSIALEPRQSLLDVMRDELGLTGTKNACNMGNCGACTVLVDGRAMYSCLMLAIDWSHSDIVTIEGLEREGELDPIQRAFLRADAFQCGFCTAGQIMSLKALLDQTPAPSDEQIERALSGNLCRCGAYRNLLEAGRLAAGRETNDTAK